MTREEECRAARQLLLTALASTPGIGMTETSFRRITSVGTSLFHEVMPDLLGQGLVVISHGDGRRTQTEYHLIRVQEDLKPLEGPVTVLAARVLAQLSLRAEGARALAKTLGLEVGVAQMALDELEAFRLVRRSQVGMLVIYRANPR